MAASAPEPSFGASSEFQVASLPAVPWYHRRVVGHSIGTSLVISGGSLAVWSLLRHGRWSRIGVYSSVLGGAGFFAIGIYLLRKGYFKDPEALKEYRAEFEARSLKEVLNRYGWDGVRQFVSDRELSVKFQQEIGPKGFNSVWTTYGEDSLTRAVTGSVISAAFLRARFLQDLDGSGPEPALIGANLLNALRQCGEFAVTVLKVDGALVHGAVQKDAIVSAMDWSEIVHYDIRDRFFGDVRKNGRTFDALYRRFRSDLMYVVDSGIVKPAELRDIFLATRDGMTLTEFADKYWDWPTRPWGAELMPADEFEKMKILQKEYEAYKQLHDQQVLTAGNQARSQESSAAATYEASERLNSARASEARAHGRSAAAYEDALVRDRATYEAAVAKVKQDREAKERELRVALEEHKIKIDKSWSEWLLEKRHARASAGSAPNLSAATAAATSAVSNQVNINVSFVAPPGFQPVPMPASPAQAANYPPVAAMPLPPQSLPTYASAPAQLQQSFQVPPPFNPELVQAPAPFVPASVPQI